MNITKATLRVSKNGPREPKKDGFLEASEDILEAASKMEEANKHLNKAKEGLFHQ
ncbi:hypothetical protein [Methanosarcina barkeri]|uniref:hypothetical protein n=1 Tax=Methanosarcina barkeri TaxID=2208 RepID=UPI001FB43E03|nr:hypothetical protein [Methanosarcina barkeri]